jgi:hypothetical protein
LLDAREDSLHEIPPLPAASAQVAGDYRSWQRFCRLGRVSGLGHQVLSHNPQTRSSLRPSLYGGSRSIPRLTIFAPCARRQVAWWLILSCAKNAPLEHFNVCSGKWQTTVGRDLLGSTLGIFGLGGIGSAMVPIAKGELELPCSPVLL